MRPVMHVYCVGVCVCVFVHVRVHNMCTVSAREKTLSVHVYIQIYITAGLFIGFAFGVGFQKPANFIVICIYVHIIMFGSKNRHVVQPRGATSEERIRLQGSTSKCVGNGGKRET